jgi:hypothetical protein
MNWAGVGTRQGNWEPDYIHGTIVGSACAQITSSLTWTLKRAPTKGETETRTRRAGRRFLLSWQYGLLAKIEEEALYHERPSGWTGLHLGRAENAVATPAKPGFLELH